MLKFKDILNELEKPSSVYQDSSLEKNRKINNLSPSEKEKLFQQGQLLIPTKSDNPEKSASDVVYLPAIDQVKKDIIKDKKEFEVFQFHPDDDIKEIAKAINSYYNKLYKLINALDKLIELKKSGRI